MAFLAIHNQMKCIVVDLIIRSLEFDDMALNNTESQLIHAMENQVYEIKRNLDVSLDSTGFVLKSYNTIFLTNVTQN